MKKIIDIHSHMLPCVDDGCPSKEEALEMLKMYEDQNVEAVICTPHFGPCQLTGADVNKTFDWLKSVKSNVNLYLGNEILYNKFTELDVMYGDALTLAESKYILVEFEDWMRFTPAMNIFLGLRSLVRSEYKPILAHPERYYSLQAHPIYYRKIYDLGVEFQINAYDIVENPDYYVQKITQFLLKSGMVSYIGSDAHGAKRRSPSLKTGVEWIYDNCETEYADAIVHDNAKKIIGGA